MDENTPEAFRGEPNRRICYHGVAIFGVVGRDGTPLMSIRMMGHAPGGEEHPKGEIIEFVTDPEEALGLARMIVNGFQMMTEDPDYGMAPASAPNAGGRFN